MSLLSPRPGIALTPERVALRIGKARHERPCREPGWPGALRELSTLLEQYKPDRACDIVLSQHFAATHLLPPTPVALKPEETLAWIADKLTDSFQDQVQTWRLAWQPAPADESILVGAMRQERYDELLETLQRAGLRGPTSVRAWLAACCDRHWRQLAQGRHWLILAEPGHFTLAALSGGRFLQVRGQRAGPDLGADIEAQLGREKLLGHLPDAATGPVATAGLADGVLDSRFGRRLAGGPGDLSGMLGD